MTDRYDQDLLLDYLEGDLDPAARAQVDQMLAGDPALSSLMQSLAEDRTQLRAMPAEQAPGNLNFDLVQGLERRMLLDAPQVEPAAGPIPIARGHDMAPPVNGWRWGRIIGLTGMAAAIAMAAGLVIWFDQINPLSQTAFKMSAPAQESAGVQAPTDQAAESLAAGEADNALSNLQLETTPGGPGAPGAPGNIADHPGPEARLADNSGADPSRARGAGSESEALDMEERQATPPAIDAAVADVVADAAAGAPTAAATRGGRAGGAPAFALEPTISISALAPDQSLRIETDDPDTSKAQVLDWCLRNGVPIVEPQANAAIAQAHSPDEAPAQAPIAILIEQPQLDALVHEMNRITVTQRFNRQRAVLDEADDSFYNQQQNAQHPAQLEEFADGGAQTQSPQFVELRVPEDLGDEQLTRQNIDNTWIYQNRADFANAAQREAQESLAAHDADDTDPTPPADNTEDENAVAIDGAAHAEPEAVPGEEGTPQGPMADALEESDKRPAAPRGNWLLAQVPLASTTSIWNDPPRALLVPVIFVRRMTDEAEPRTPIDDAPADAEQTERADDNTDEPITPATPIDD